MMGYINNPNKQYPQSCPQFPVVSEKAHGCHQKEKLRCDRSRSNAIGLKLVFPPSEDASVGPIAFAPSSYQIVAT